MQDSDWYGFIFAKGAKKALLIFLALQKVSVQTR
jgi:hypothetical protein